ncbi:MAG: hypothetical protein AB1758_00900 [Candidatus Eremiobacterota bacterium]
MPEAQSARQRRLRRLLRLLALAVLFFTVVLAYWVVALWNLFRRGPGLRLDAPGSPPPAGEGMLLELLRQGYPDPPSGEEELALLAFLAARLAPDRAVRAVAALTGRSADDLRGRLAGLTEQSEQSEAVRARLALHGFEDWIRRYA